MKFIKKEVKKKKKIFLYGASTKEILNNITSSIIKSYLLLLKKVEKWKKYTVGSGIKIISEQKARELNPDYFLVTPWGFIKEFVKRESSWLKKGGKFIVPFPRFKLVK